MNISSNHIIGANTRGDRQVDDYYPSPIRIIDDLYKLGFNFNNKTVWENACGDGRLIERAKHFWDLNFIGSDIINRGFEDTNIVNFLRNPNWFLDTYGEYPDAIITNPPYKYLNEWIIKSLEALKDGGELFLLCKLTALETVSRQQIYRKNPIKTCYVYSNRLTMHKNGFETKGKGMLAFCWLYWKKGYKGDIKLDFI